MCGVVALPGPGPPVDTSRTRKPDTTVSSASSCRASCNKGPTSRPPNARVSSPQNTMNGEWPRRSKVALVALVVFLATLALGALWNATCFLPHCDNLRTAQGKNLHTAPAVIEKPTDFVGGQLQCAKSVAMQPCADSKKTSSSVSAEWLRNADPCLLVNGIQHIDAQYH